MTIVELIASREADWEELAVLTKAMKRGSFSRALTPDDVARFTRLFRASCNDLAFAESNNFPPKTVAFLNDLVINARRVLYRKRRFDWTTFSRVLFLETPRWVVTDVVFWIAFVLFWLPFILCICISQPFPDFAARLVGERQLDMVENMYSHDFQSDWGDRIPMVAWYLWHNGSIGLRAFAFSMFGCLPGVYTLVFNSVFLGCIYGYMTSSFVAPHTTANFLEFTTAHGPFELTAVVLLTAVGMRLGFSWIDTRGYSRVDAFQRAAVKVAPSATLAFIFFGIAATIEALISPNPMEGIEYWGLTSLFVKQTICWISIGTLLIYFFGLGLLDFWVRLYKLALEKLRNFGNALNSLSANTRVTLSESGGNAING